VPVEGYGDVLAIKERAEAHSTAPYRAPELFEPPGRGGVDERSDVFSLGGVLFFAMFGKGPFDYALREGGGSITLAVLSRRPEWPADWGPFPPEYAGGLRELAERCLEDAARRCTVQGAIRFARGLRAQFAGEAVTEARGGG